MEDRRGFVVKQHRVDSNYHRKLDKLRLESFELVGLALGAVNSLGGILLIVYLLYFKDNLTMDTLLVPFVMFVIGVVTYQIRSAALKEKHKIMIYSLNYLLIPFNLYIFMDDVAVSFWVLTFLYVTLAFALQSRGLVILSVISSFAGLLFILAVSPAEVVKVVTLEDHLIRLVLFSLFVCFIFAGLKIIRRKELMLLLNMKKVENIAYKNPLLNMNNQLDFHQYVDYELVTSHFLIAKIEIKDFQSVYDILGQSHCDHLLHAVKKRLMVHSDKVSYIAKGEGGQFFLAFKIDEVLSTKDYFLRKLLKELGKIYKLDGMDYKLNINIGTSNSFTDGATGDELLRNAQFALNKCNQLGMNQLFPCTQELKESSLRKIELSNGIYKANFAEEFHLVYQPQVSLETNEIVGVEALVRWNHPQLGFISPGDFIDIAEQNGSIVSLGRWIFRKACEDIQQLNSLSQTPLKLAVNVSFIEIQQTNFVNNIVAILEETKFPPTLLEIELTERTFMQNEENELKKIQKLQSLGISVAIDDFGTGYSTFDVLKKLKIDKIKIPREFISYVDQDVSNQRIVQTIISLADRFDIICLAEGIERQEENDFLKLQACQEIQGYYYSRPVKLEDFQTTLAAFAKPVCV